MSNPFNIRMDTADAFQIVLDLARQNIIDVRDNPEEHARQVAACNIIEDVSVNDYGDD